MIAANRRCSRMGRSAEARTRHHQEAPASFRSSCQLCRIALCWCIGGLCLGALPGLLLGLGFLGVLDGLQPGTFAALELVVRLAWHLLTLLGCGACARPTF